MSRVSLGGIPFDDIGARAAVARIINWARAADGGYVCTPNVDYVVRSRRDPVFREAILAARLRVPDGMGVIYGSRLAGRPLSESVTGRLLPELITREARQERLPVAIFGGGPGVAERAGRALQTMGAHVVEAFGPGMGFRLGSAEDAAATRRLAQSGARIVYVGLGAPKQEIWMRAKGLDLPSAVFVGIGAGVDVLGGRSPEAPRWMTRVGLEWTYRLAHEPRRLARRYLWDDPPFFWWMILERVRSRRRA